MKEMCAILNSFGTFVLLLLLLDFQLADTFFFFLMFRVTELTKTVERLSSVEVAQSLSFPFFL